MSIDSISGLSSSMTFCEMIKTRADLEKSLERLATGRRINRASDDPTGVGMATRLESQVRGLAVGERTAQMGVSMIQTAEGSLQGVTQDLQRIRELALQAANGTLNHADRATIQIEITGLVENIDSTLRSAEFNSKPVFTGRVERLQMGPGSSGTVTIDLPELTSGNLGLASIDVGTQEGAENAISAASDALDKVLGVRANLGATQNRLESAVGSLSQTRTNTLGSLSAIRDMNMAEGIMSSLRAMNNLESQLLVLGQMKKIAGSVMSLLSK